MNIGQPAVYGSFGPFCRHPWDGKRGKWHKHITSYAHRLNDHVPNQILTAQKTRTLPERLMDTGVISNSVVAYALGRIGQ